jgi:hypothetical protein
MSRPLAPVQLQLIERPPHGPVISDTLLSAFPLTVMMPGALLALFALIMALSADAEGAVRPNRTISCVSRSPAMSPVATPEQIVKCCG